MKNNLKTRIARYTLRFSISSVSSEGLWPEQVHDEGHHHPDHSKHHEVTVST